MDPNEYILPLATEGSTLGYFLSMCQHQPSLLSCSTQGNTVFQRSSPVSYPIFVVGCPRSGTSVVGSCLSKHSCIGGGYESLCLLELSRLYYGLHQGVNRRKFSFLDPLISGETLLSGIGDLMDCIIVSVLNRQRKTRYVDHTPWYIGLMPFISTLYPHSTFVHVIRDGRDVACSLLDAYQQGFAWAGATLTERARLWRSLVALGRDCSKNVGNGLYIELSYESLCLDPRQTLGSLLSQLGLHWEEAVLSPLAEPIASPSRRNATLARVDEDGTVVLTPYETGNRWPAHWSRDERMEFTDAAGDLLSTLRYAT